MGKIGGGFKIILLKFCIYFPDCSMDAIKKKMVKLTSETEDANCRANKFDAEIQAAVR